MSQSLHTGISDQELYRCHANDEVGDNRELCPHLSCRCKRIVLRWGNDDLGCYAKQFALYPNHFKSLWRVLNREQQVQALYVQ